MNPNQPNQEYHICRESVSCTIGEDNGEGAGKEEKVKQMAFLGAKCNVSPTTEVSAPSSAVEFRVSKVA